MHAITRYYLFINKMIEPAEVKKNIALNIVTSKKQGMHSRYRLYITLRQMKTLLIVFSLLPCLVCFVLFVLLTKPLA